MWTLPRKVVLGRRKTMMTFSAVLVTLCLASTVHGNQLGPVKSNPNAQQRPQAARRPVLQQNVAPDPLDSHLDRMFANFDEKNGKDDSLWDRLKRNFVEEDAFDGEVHHHLVPPHQQRPDQRMDLNQLAPGSNRNRRSFWKKEGTLIKPRWLAKIYEVGIVATKAAIKVIDKSFGVTHLLLRTEPIVEIADQVPRLFGRIWPLLDFADRMEPLYLQPIARLERKISVLYPMFNQLPQLLEQFNQLGQVNVGRLVGKVDTLLDRVNNVPIERVVELAFNLSADFKSITDLVKTAQSLIPSLLPLFLGNRGGGGGGGGSSGSSSSSSASKPAEDSSVVFFPPLDEEEEDSSEATPPESGGTPTTSPPMITMMVIDQNVLANIDPAFIAKLKPEVLRSINPAILPALTPEILEALDADKINMLEPKVLRNLRPEFIGKIDPKLLKLIPASLLNALPEELLKDFDPALLENLDPTILENLDPTFLANLDADTIRSFLLPDSKRRFGNGDDDEDPTTAATTTLPRVIAMSAHNEKFVRAVLKAFGARGARVQYRFIRG